MRMNIGFLTDHPMPDWFHQTLWDDLSEAAKGAIKQHGFKLEEIANFLDKYPTHRWHPYLMEKVYPEYQAYHAAIKAVCTVINNTIPADWPKPEGWVFYPQFHFEPDD